MALRLLITYLKLMTHLETLMIKVEILIDEDRYTAKYRTIKPPIVNNRPDVEWQHAPGNKETVRQILELLASYCEDS